MIELFFLDLADKRIRRGVFQDLGRLIMAIDDYIDSTTPIRSRSSGPQRPTTSWKKSPALRWPSMTAYPV